MSIVIPANTNNNNNFSNKTRLYKYVHRDDIAAASSYKISTIYHFAN